MKKLLSIAMLSCAVTFASAAVDAKPLRLGPVSVYGTLGVKSGKIVSQASGKQVMLRGMSLFWSDATGSQYYNPTVISWAAEKLGIDVFRFAMGIKCYNSNGGDCQANSDDAIISSNSYLGNKEGKEAQLDNMVKAAIENDIYIIVDWHSHRAESEKSYAKDFFGRMAAKYKDVPNIIWEVYNEPVNTDMGTIAGYANEVISTIRGNGSKHLALVGTPFYSQMGSCSGVNDANSAYVFHFYAASHSLGSFKGNIENCLNGGKAVFITEWGTTDANGTGNVSSSETNNWTSYMDQKNIPNCNWSLRHESIGGKNEASAMFSGSTLLNSKSALNSATYTTSGNLVKSYLTKHNNKNWADSLVAGKNTGSCAFKGASASEMDGTITGKAVSSCTYTSSDPTVATVENGTIKINGAGYAVMTGNDNSQSVVLITQVPAQTFEQAAITCRITGGGACNNFTGNSSAKLEYKMKVTKTVEGSDVTYESDNPSVISVAKATCTSSECYGDKGKQVWIATFKSRGTANIHATAKAISGYRALDTTITFSLLKAEQTLNTKYFKDQTVALNSTTQVFTLEAHKVPVTYTIYPAGYAEQQGVNLIAGGKNATVIIKAEAPENDQYESLLSYIKIVIGTGDVAMEAQAWAEIQGQNFIAPKTQKNLAPTVRMNGNQLVVDVKRSGFVKVQVLDVAGRNVVSNVSRYMKAGTNTVDLANVPRGLYIVAVKDGSAMQTIRWRNK